MAGWPSSSATTPILEKTPLRRGGGGSPGGAGGEDDPGRAVGGQCVIDGGARLVAGDRDCDRHVRKDHAVVERDEWENGIPDIAHVELDNAGAARRIPPLTRTCVRFNVEHMFASPHRRRRASALCVIVCIFALALLALPGSSSGAHPAREHVVPPGEPLWAL